jgi:hypothetical protein
MKATDGALALCYGRGRTQAPILIVIYEDRDVSCIEGPMTDDHPWQSDARKAREQHAVQ